MQKGISPRVREYISSPRFIHDYLVVEMDGIARRIRDSALMGGTMAPLLLFWTEERVPTTDGKDLVTHLILMELKEEQVPNQQELLRKGAEHTKACAVGLFSPAPAMLKLVLESKHGSETWLMPRQTRGDVLFVREPQRQSNVDSLGIFETQG